MANAFNPYRDWLGLADGQRPATYYGLFGLKPLENDAERIRKAIVRLMAKIRAIHPGDRMREWQQIMGEISAGKTCLTDPAAKAAYDAQLREAFSRQKPPSQSRTAPSPKTVVPPPPSSAGPPPPGMPMPPPVSSPAPGSVPPAAPPPVAGPPPWSAEARYGRPAAPQGYPPPQPAGQAGGGQEFPDFTAPQSYVPPDTGQAGPSAWAAKPSIARRSRRNKSSTSMVGPVIAVLAMVVLGLVGLVAYREYEKSLASARPHAKPKVVEKLPPPKADDSDKLKVNAQPQADPAVMKKSLADAIVALGKRDVSGARSAVSQAAANATSPEDQTAVQKYERLCESVGKFWGIIWERVNKFRPSEAVALGRTRIFVVEAGGGRFSYKVGKKIHVCSAESVPSWLAIALAEANLGSDPSFKELYAAFLAVDPDGDRSRARALWTEAKLEESLPPIDSLPPPTP